MHFSPRVVALAAILLAGQALSQQQCHIDYEEVAGECFRFLPGLDTTWEGARTVCQDDGADLAVIKDCDVFEELVRHIHVNGLEPGLGYWIGGTDNGDAGDWSWIDDTQMAMGVPFWGRGELLENEPSGGEEENCAALFESDRYYMHDFVCEEPLVAICELMFHEPGSPCPDPYVPVDMKCLTIDQEISGDWSSQRQNCQSLGGDLAVLDNCLLFRDLVDYLHFNGMDRLGSFWIGGTDQGNEGSWFWVNGVPMEMGVPYWGRRGNGTDQPGSEGGEQNCANLWTDDRLYFHDDFCEESEGRSPLCHFAPEGPPPEAEDD